MRATKHTNNIPKTQDFNKKRKSFLLSGGMVEVEGGGK